MGFCCPAAPSGRGSLGVLSSRAWLQRPGARPVPAGPGWAPCIPRCRDGLRASPGAVPAAP